MGHGEHTDPETECDAPVSQSSDAAPHASDFEFAQLDDLGSAFFAALCNPDGGEALYRLHAPDAPVRQGDGIGPARAIDADRFAATHRDISRRGELQLPRFASARLRQICRSERATEAIAWFEAQESRESRQIFVAFGVRTEDAGPRVVWSSPAEQMLPWSFREGLLQSLADYPWMRRAEPALPRSLLDAGYFRRYWRPALQFSTLPEARFSCHMSGACCRHDYEITLPPEAQLLLDAMPWDTLAPALAGTRLPVRADGQLQLKSPEEVCRFLGAGNQCLIHRTLGRQPFGACCVFPFSFAQTPQGIAVGLSPICASARHGHGIPAHQRLEDLRERLVHARPRSTDSYRLAPGVALAWEPFRDIEQGLCDCLAAEEMPLRRRLHVGARLLGALADGSPVDVPAWRSEPVPALTPELRAAIHGMLARLLGWNRAVLRELPREIPESLPTLEVEESAVMAQILRNTLFCKVYSYPLDLTTAHNYLIVLYLLALLMQSAAPGPLPEHMWRELGSLGVHGLLKSMLHDGMPEGFRTLLGRSEFGVWMLAA